MDHLGTGHNLLPERGGGGGGIEDFRGNHLMFGRTEGGISRNWEPKGRIAENFERIQKGTSQICLENEDIRGWDRESHQNLLGGITSVKEHSKGGSAKFHLV